MIVAGASNWGTTRSMAWRAFSVSGLRNLNVSCVTSPVGFVMTVWMSRYWNTGGGVVARDLADMGRKDIAGAELIGPSLLLFEVGAAALVHSVISQALVTAISGPPKRWVVRYSPMTVSGI